MRDLPARTKADFRGAEWQTKSAEAKDIIHRDQVHGDVQYDRLSVALLNTKAMQRLGRVYQLGYSHLVFDLLPLNAPVFG
jgi:hypothetical protein